MSVRCRGATISVTNKIPLRKDALGCAAQTETDRGRRDRPGTVRLTDLTECKARVIVVSSVRNYAVASLLEHMFMLILALRRNLAAYRADVESGKWQKAETF